MGNLIGYITVPNGGPPPQNVLVTIEARGATVDSQYCDAEGRFAFYQVVSNPYHVIIKDPAYYPVDEVAVVDPLIEQTTTVHIFLTPRAPAPSEKPPNSVSGGNPNEINAARYKEKVPKEALKEFRAGVKADHKKHLEKAIRHYEMAVHISPNFYQARNNLGTDYLRNRKVGEAKAQFDRVIKLNPDDPEAYFNLGNLNYILKRYPQAETAVREGLQRSPKSAFGKYLLGAIDAGKGQYAEAQPLFEEAQKLDPRMPEVYLQLANVYMEELRQDQAIRELKRFLKEFPENTFSPRVRIALVKLEEASRQQ